MKDELISTLTERGQVSFPASLRKKAGLKTGQKFRWNSISESEYRVTVVEEPPDKPDPFKAIGYARNKYHPEDTRTTDEIMAELREGEED